jgi:diguanylate cyclase (GGDEF)-like protein
VRGGGERRSSAPAARSTGEAGYQAVLRSRIDRERLIARLRGWALALDIIQSVLASGDSFVLTWAVAGLLAIDFLGTRWLLARDADRLHRRVGVVGMVADIVVCALVLVNNLHDPADPVFLIVVFLALEAALRWGRFGGIIGGFGAGAMAAAWGWHVIGQFEHLTMRFFTIGIVGAVTGGLVHRLDEERASMARLAYTDTLTGLFNRPALQEELRAALASDDDVALVFLDLDGFKSVNDELGHTAGDVVLAEVARRIRATVRAEDAVARLGGDEFVIVVQGEATAAVDDLATRLRLAVEHPIEVSGVSVQVGASCGAVVAGSRDHVDSLLRRADRAMYEAKRASRP